MAKVKIGNVFPPLAWLMQRCAPAGFGLGGTSALLTAKDDLNNVKANGWYYWYGDSVPANAPTMEHTSYMSCMRVWTTDGGVCCQELMDMTDSVARGVKVQRTAYVNTFYDWEWVNPPMFSGKEYRTTERWNGKPVYRKLVIFRLTNATGGEFSVPHGISNFGGLVRQNAVTQDKFQLPYMYNGNTTWVSTVNNTNIVVSNTGLEWDSSYSWNFELYYIKTTD